jgi:glutamate formiminotransferase
LAGSLVECVPNFSEGNDARVVEAIAAAIGSAPGVRVLDHTLDPDHNRSVVTFAGPPEAVSEGAFRGVAQAVARIDLNRHAGVHPRIGAADVVPFVPVRGITLEECARIAVACGERFWRELRLPVYLYEAAARRPERRNLENIRRGRYEMLRQAALSDPARRPDIGGPALHPTAGAAAVGARKFLIAFNINLDSADLALAQRIARKIRASSGGFPCVKALGVPLASRGLVQVTMNLTDYEVTPVHAVFAAVKAEAARHGAGIHSSQIIGLIPERALENSAEWLGTVEGFRDELIFERRLALS